MKIAFQCVYILLLFYFFYGYFRGRDNDHIFAPWPGYVVLFSSYFLFGSGSDEFEVTDAQWLIYILATMGFCVGGLMSKRIWGRGRYSESGENFYINTLNGRQVFFFVSLALFVTAYLWASGGIPIFSGNVDAARIAYASNGYVATFATLLDVTSVVCVAYIFCRRGVSLGDRRTLLFLLVVCVFLVVAVFSGSRSRLFKLVLPSVVLYHFIVRPLSLKKILVASVAAVFFVGGIGFYRAYQVLGDDIWYGLESAGMETPILAILYYAQLELSTAAYGLSVVVDMIPDRFSHTFGLLHIAPVLMPFQIKIPVPGMYFKDLIGGTWDGAGLAATFASPMYADFSFFGVFFFSVLYSIFFSRLYWKMKKGGRGHVYHGIVYAVMYFFMLTGMRSDFVSFEFFWFFVVASSFFLFRKKYV